MKQSRPTRAFRLLAVLALTLGVSGPVVALATPGTSGRSAGRAVSYLGFRMTVPASWPVIDLSADPGRCVRFDVHAVYLGHPGADQRCPARLVGRTEAVLVEPLDAAARGHEQPGAVTVRGHRVLNGDPNRDSDGILQVADGDAGVLVTGAYRTDRATVRAALQSALPVPAAAGAAARPVPVTPAGYRQPTTPAVPAAGPAPTASYYGRGFDTCAAPSLATLQAWAAASPYRAIGVYVGGLNRACGWGNLSAGWIAAATAAGWKMIPTYVGYQAPCNQQGGMATINPAQAYPQGVASADDAVVQMAALGMGAGNPVYNDMEYYYPDPACRQSVLTFLTGWTTELHHRGYLSGVYSSSAAGIHDLAGVVGNPAYTPPDDIFMANWNGVAGVYNDPWVPNTDWIYHQRLHQYLGGHNETYRGATINIDSDFLDGAVGVAGGGGGAGGGSGTVYPHHVMIYPYVSEHPLPTYNSPTTRTWPYGAVVNILCQTRGPYVAGTGVWDRLDDGGYVTDAYVDTTGHDTWSPPIPQC
jgi:hypothetical protein